MSNRIHARVLAGMMLAGFTIMLWLGQALAAAPSLAAGAILWQADGSGYYVLKSGTLAYGSMDTGTVRRLARTVQQVTWVRIHAP